MWRIWAEVRKYGKGKVLFQKQVIGELAIKGKTSSSHQRGRRRIYQGISQCSTKIERIWSIEDLENWWEE